MASEQVTRRGFVETAGVAAGAVAAFGAPAIGREEAPSRRHRLGLIGAGSRGGQLLDSFLAQKDVDVVAIADVDDRHAGATADRDGFYEIELRPGDYTLCTYSCTEVSVPSGVVRYDWISGPGGGEWERE